MSLQANANGVVRVWIYVQPSFSTQVLINCSEFAKPAISNVSSKTNGCERQD